MIHELRTYTIQAGKLGAYVELSGTVGRPIRGDRFGKLLGYWTSEHGTLNQVVHLWEYRDLAARAEARAGLARDARWTTDYIPRSQPLLVAQENVLLVPADWYPLRPTTGMGVYELRSYRLQPGKVGEWMTHFREGLAARAKYSAPAGLWTTEVGPLNSVVHLWGYRDAGQRAEARRAAAADADWQAVVGRLGPLMQVMESKLLLPTDFSPLH